MALFGRNANEPGTSFLPRPAAAKAGLNTGLPSRKREKKDAPALTSISDVVILKLHLGRSGEIGRRARLKIWCPRGRVGSSPTFGTSLTLKITEIGVVWRHFRVSFAFSSRMLGAVVIFNREAKRSWRRRPLSWISGRSTKKAPLLRFVKIHSSGFLRLGKSNIFQWKYSLSR